MSFETYNLLRGLHILAIIAWMAGLLMLPRLFVYQMQVERGSSAETLLMNAQRRLMAIIMNPAMILAWLLGLALLHYNASVKGWEVLLEPWLVTKLLFVLLVSAWHGVLSGARRKFAEGRNTRSEKFWRMTNELPFLAAIVMVLAVTTEFRW